MDDKLGQILIEMELITREQLEEALIAQRQLNLSSAKKFKLGEMLLFSQAIRLSDLQAALRRQTSKASASRDAIVDSRRKQREEELQSLKEASSPAEDTFLGRLKGLFQKKH